VDVRFCLRDKEERMIVIKELGVGKVEGRGCCGKPREAEGGIERSPELREGEAASPPRAEAASYISR